jgi:hypothetical protein
VLAALYLRQPFAHPPKPARVRLAPHHLATASAFIDGCDAAGFHDCVRLFDALFSAGALDLVAHPREFGIDASTLAYLRRDRLKRTLPSAKEPKLEEVPAIAELRKALGEYCASKRELEGAPGFVTSERLDDLVAKEEVEVPERAKEGPADSIGVRRVRLRDRAFETFAVPRESVVDVKVESETKAETKTKPSAIGTKRPKPVKIKKFY